jgi:hypothetical protein
MSHHLLFIWLPKAEKANFAVPFNILFAIIRAIAE